MAAQRIRLNFWRCSRWMTMGTAPPSANQSRAGLKNPILGQLAPNGQAARQVLRQLHVEVLVGGDPDVVDHLPDAAFADLLAKLVDLRQIRLPQGARVDQLLG